MKKIKSRAKRISLVAAVCMLLCTFGALAEGSGFEVIDPPSVEAATGIATVSGLLNATETNVVLMVFMPGTQLEGILNTPAALTEKLYYTDGRCQARHHNPGNEGSCRQGIPYRRGNQTVCGLRPGGNLRKPAP